MGNAIWIYQSGKQQFVPAVRRLLLGEHEEAGIESPVVLEINLDDSNQEIIGFAMERLQAEGALVE